MIWPEGASLPQDTTPGWGLPSATLMRALGDVPLVRALHTLSLRVPSNQISLQAQGPQASHWASCRERCPEQVIEGREGLPCLTRSAAGEHQEVSILHALTQFVP